MYCLNNKKLISIFVQIPKRLTLVIVLLGIFGGNVRAGSQYSQQSQSTRPQTPQQQQTEPIQLPGFALTANQQAPTFQLIPFGINLNPPSEAQQTPSPTPPPISSPSPTPPVSVSAAVQTRHQVMEYDVPASTNNVEPTTLEITSNPTPLNLVFKSFSTPINIQQVHQSSEAIAQESSSEDEPHRLLHSIVKPVLQDIREVIIPIRRVTQQITPVQEEIQTFVARGMSQLTNPGSTATFSAPSSAKQLSGPAGYVKVQNQNQNQASTFSASSKSQSKTGNQPAKQLSAPATTASTPTSTQTAKQLSAPASNSISSFAQSLSRYLTQTQPLQLSAPLLTQAPSQFFIPAPAQLFAQQLPAQLMLAQAAAQGQFLAPALFGSQIPTPFLIPQLFSAGGGQMIAPQPGITAPRLFIQTPTQVPMQLSQSSSQEQTQGQMLAVPAISQTSPRGLRTMAQNSNDQQMTIGRQLMIPSSAVRFIASTPGQLLVQPQMAGQFLTQPQQAANDQLQMTSGQFLTQPLTTVGQFLTQPQTNDGQSVSQPQNNGAQITTQPGPTTGQTLAQPQTNSNLTPQLFATRSSTPLFTPSALQLVASGGANLFSNPIEIPTATPQTQQQPQQGRFIELLPARASTPTPFSSTSFSSAPNSSPNTFTSASFSSSTSSSPNSFVLASRNTGKSSIEILGNGSQGKRENVQVFGARIKK